MLLTFDEFEKLEEAEQKGLLDLPLLLDWFRKVIQYRPRLALLFSGVHMLSEMGTTAGVNWSSYFVNVQTLRVTFLQPNEARDLITRPTPDYPSEEIFGDGVVDTIFTETACHPFLIQAVCSALIDGLNAEKKGRAVVSDVQKAIDKVLEGWHGYFHELWTRTDGPQQACLFALQTLGAADLSRIQQASSLDEKTVRRTLQTLLRRDLVRRDDGGAYCIATPLFRRWVERNG